jgi:hypothetical protein
LLSSSILNHFILNAAINHGKAESIFFIDCKIMVLNDASLFSILSSGEVISSVTHHNFVRISATMTYPIPCRSPFKSCLVDFRLCYDAISSAETSAAFSELESGV